MCNLSCPETEHLSPASHSERLPIRSFAWLHLAFVNDMDVMASVTRVNGLGASLGYAGSAATFRPQGPVRL